MIEMNIECNIEMKLIVCDNAFVQSAIDTGSINVLKLFKVKNSTVSSL